MSKDSGGSAFPCETIAEDENGQYRTPYKGMTLREYYAGEAMQIVMAETQETVPAKFWDWIKQLAFQSGATFLHVEYRVVNGVYEGAAKRAFAYADAMLNERTK